ncbi:metallophosphoesterase [Paenibacillus sinopodophylli]|uniref:metallophosphoesterase n=1 Tax=Paenibacillus sinopodophylli TaxID=1837342 RepID=UPI00148615E3|nr:metallophosphoesterase [Paenibacillus sinopodophylli]
MPLPIISESRLLAIADIHGYHEELLLLLQKASYNPLKDQLILLGDYIDADEPATWRSLSIIKQLASEGAKALLGNQELKLLAAERRDKRLSLPHQQWLQSLPFYHLDRTYLFVHAGIRPGIPLAKQSHKDLTEIRDGFIYEKLTLQDECQPYVIIFGHTPTFKLKVQPGELWHGDRRIAIDTGAKHGYRLTLLDLTSKLSYSCSTASTSRGGHMRITSLPPHI